MKSDIRQPEMVRCHVLIPRGFEAATLPKYVKDMTPEQHRRYLSLWRLADQNKTTVQISEAPKP